MGVQIALAPIFIFILKIKIFMLLLFYCTLQCTRSSLFTLKHFVYLFESRRSLKTIFKHSTLHRIKIKNDFKSTPCCLLFGLECLRCMYMWQCVQYVRGEVNIELKSECTQNSTKNKSIQAYNSFTLCHHAIMVHNTTHTVPPLCM